MADEPEVEAAAPAAAPAPKLFKKRVLKKGNKLDVPRVRARARVHRRRGTTLTLSSALQKGCTVKVTYSGKIEGHEEEFDTTYDKKKKSHQPLCVVRRAELAQRD